MKLPKLNGFENYDPKSEEQTLKIEYIPKPVMYSEGWKDDPKQLVRIIRKIETYIRGSVEFKSYIKYLKECLDLNKCLFLNEPTGFRNTHFKIELHHGPFTLFDITAAVFNKFFNNPDYPIEKATFWKVAAEVTKLHYEMKVGLVPLSVTAHELVHNGEIFIPLSCYFGNYEAFLSEYNKFIPDDIKSTFLLQQQLTDKFEKGALNPDSNIFKKVFTYLNVEGQEYPKITDIKIKESISSSLEELKPKKKK